MALDPNGRCSEKLEYLKKYTVFVYRKLLLDDLNLNKYTNTVFSEDHQKLHQETIQHQNNWIVPNGTHLRFTDYFSDNPNMEIPIVDVAHLDNNEISTEKHLEIELQEFNARLVIVKHWLQHYLNRTNDLEVNQYFQTQLDHVTTLLHLNEQVLNEVLHMAPNTVEIQQNNDDRSDLIGWYATREHLKILVYANSALTRLQQICGENM